MEMLAWFQEIYFISATPRRGVADLKYNMVEVTMIFIGDSYKDLRQDVSPQVWKWEISIVCYSRPKPSILISIEKKTKYLHLRVWN